MKKRKLLLLFVAAFLPIGLAAQTKLTLNLDQTTKEVSPMLYGLMTEEINFSYEGGLYAQLVRNPSFKDDRNGMRRNSWTPWRSGGPSYWSLNDTLNASMRIDPKGGFNRANPVALCLNVKKTGNVAILNDGYWGFPVRSGAHFRGSLYVRKLADGAESMTVSLVSTDGKKVYASTKVSGLTHSWQKIPFILNIGNREEGTKDVRLRISPDGVGSYALTRVTLFPDTYNHRENGLRPDLMTLLKGMSPKFIRFPGGNYVEGNDFCNRFNWKETVGDPDNRPGHFSPWGYRSSDGMGLLEFLDWAEDLGAEPLLAVFAGYTLNGDYLTSDYIGGFVQDALDEIEYITGGPDTKWGAQRVRDGHLDPFPLHYVEIGNEDFFDKSESYPGRYKRFYDAIKARYPQLQIISTMDARMMAQQAKDTGVEGIKLDVVDEHYYRNTEGMFRAANQYDTYSRKGPKVFCGEWASREGEPTTNMNAALGDAAWMTCMERNSDLVIASCYAPLFVNVNPGGMQWKSDLIGYNALTAYGSPSYYAQCMFSQHVGNKIVPVKVSGMPELTYGKEQLPQLYYSATTNTHNGKIYLKVVNGGSTVQNAEVMVNGGKVSRKGTMIVLRADRPEETNRIDDPCHIVPVSSKIKVSKDFHLKLSPYSITVIEM
jgi:alpha-N-arabinofuranosidase